MLWGGRCQMEGQNLRRPQSFPFFLHYENHPMLGIRHTQMREMFPFVELKVNVNVPESNLKNGCLANCKRLPEGR